MTKIVTMVVLSVILGGVAMFLAGHYVAPGVNTKGQNLNTSITTTTVNQTTGAVTATAP